MKKIKLLLFSLVCLVVCTNTVKAASITVSANTKSVIVGNSVTVSVTVNGTGAKEGKVGAWEYCISYDSKYLKLTSSTADANTCVKTGAYKLTGVTEKFTFKALKSGSSKVSIKTYGLYDYETENQMKGVSVGSVSIKAMTQSELEATYSTNAKLKSLSVDKYDLNPKFSKTVFKYDVEVPNDVDKVTVSAAKDDSLATMSGTGEVSLSEGLNKVEILVTSQKGNTLTYTINITRKELNPIKVNVGGKEYTLIRKEDEIPSEKYPSFEETTVNYDADNEIPALHSDITNYTLVGLKNTNGDIIMYVYDDGVKEKYVEVKSDSISLNPLALPESDDFSLYEKSTTNFNGEEVECYKLNDSAKTVVIYGQDVDTGKSKNYFLDLAEKSLIPYNDDISVYFHEKLEIYKYVIYGALGFILFLILCLFIRKPKIVEKTVVIRTPEPIKEEKEEVKEEIPEEKEEVQPEEVKKEETVPEPPKKGKRGRPSKKKINTTPEGVSEITINENK